MYEIMRRPEGLHADDEASAFDAPDGIRLRMRENRSRLTEHGRETFTVLILLFMAMAILPALQGRWLVPLFALSTMAALVLALEWHQRNPPPEEWLELSDGRFVWRGRSRAAVDLPSYWLRFELERRGPTDCRLVFHHRMQRFGVGHCLNLDERREIAPILARALAASNHMRKDMAPSPPRRIAALRRFRRRCWAAVGLCLLMQVGSAAAQNWAAAHPAQTIFFQKEIVR